MRSSQFVIHSGDLLLLEQHTAVLDAKLEATALEPAILGEVLKVRLKVTGKVVLAVATGTGRANLAPADEAKR
jgi:flagella basal body P-ring formation protein FlgA